MLWYKSWLETRWRFLIGLAILMLSVIGTVLAYPRVERVLPLASIDTSSLVGQRIKAIADLSRTYAGYIWAQWLRQNNVQMLSLFAAILGAGGLLSQAAGGGGLFTLSLPVSRDRLFGVRAATGLTELAVLAFVPSLLLPLLSPAVGQTFGSRRGARLQRVRLRRRDRAVQRDVPALHGLLRRLAAGADRLRRRRRARHCRTVLRHLLALQPVRNHGRRDLFP